ncbi:hypothetical protein SEA_YOSIF_35 [Streptomyces phage Yosif]|uniref:Uncharacterized protein n=1 Tax=Streptomyces phage Yosif TaxID=2201421 RepID=A0A2Z4QBT5_9CAUD|nr:hypothetical protein KGG71_gp35 [Streptomyces phage Yosif]AWY07599.1 hypothetical protein SEA_YOSIF_35 [Streptomyces phage Yosif]
MSENRSLTVTIKYGKGYEETWAVFKGSTDEIRQDIVDYFGFQRDSVAGLTLSELVVEATSIAHGTGNVAKYLGGTIIGSEPNPPAATPAASSSNEDPWASAGSTSAPANNWPPAAASAPAEDSNPNAYILGEIEKQTDVAGLKRLWAENQSFFSDASVMAAWKAKGKALQSAA